VKELTRCSEWILIAASTTIALLVAAVRSRAILAPAGRFNLMQIEGLNWSLLTGNAMLRECNIVSVVPAVQAPYRSSKFQSGCPFSSDG